MKILFLQKKFIWKYSKAHLQLLILKINVLKCLKRSRLLQLVELLSFLYINFCKFAHVYIFFVLHSNKNYFFFYSTTFNLFHSVLIILQNNSYIVSATSRRHSVLIQTISKATQHSINIFVRPKFNDGYENVTYYLFSRRLPILSVSLDSTMICK